MAHPQLKPVDMVAYEPVMLMLSKARVLAWVLNQLAEQQGNNLVNAINSDAPNPEDAYDWLRATVSDALEATHNEIEREYRKLGTNLLEEEAAALAKPKDGA